MGSYHSSLVGRSAEQSLLRDGFARAVSGRAALALIGGEAGIGKTSLVRDFLDHARAGGAAALAGGCYDLQVTPPFGPWADLTRVGGTSDIADIFLNFARDVRGDQPVRSRAELFHRYADAISQVAQSQPIVVALEDLHWSDPDSLDLLRFLVRTADTIPLFLIATYRDDEVEPGTPLYDRLPMLVRETDATRVDLRRLTPEDTRELVIRRYHLADADAMRLVAYLEELAQGNPLFIHELLRALEADGSLQHPSIPAREWRFSQTPRGHVPALIRQVIDRRLQRLGKATRQALDVAAVIGGDIPLDLWRSVARLSDAELTAVVESSVAAHVMEERDGHLWFAHALYRASLYRDLPLPVRRDLHRRIAETLGRGSMPDADMVGHHFHQAGDPRAATWLVRAGDRARRMYAWLAAAERYEMALLADTAATEPTIDRGWLLYQTALLWRYADLVRAMAYLEEALEIAIQAGDRTLEIGVRYHRGLFLTWTGQVRRGLSELRLSIDAMETLDDHDYRRLNAIELFGDRRSHEHRGTLVGCLASAGYYSDAIHLGERDLDVPRSDRMAWPSGATSSAYADGFLGLADVYANLGDPEKASRAHERARQAYRQIDHHHQIGWSYLDELVGVVIPYRTDDLGARTWIAEEGVRAWESSSETVPLPYPELGRLPLLHLEGRWDEARRVAEGARSAGLASEITVPILATLAQDAGDDGTFWSLVHERLPAGHLTEPGDTVFPSATHLQRLAVALHLRRGEFERASNWLTAHDRWMEWSGAVRGQADRWLLHARYTSAVGDATAALRHAYQALEIAQYPRQPLAMIAAHRFLGRSLTARSSRRALDHLEESLALSQSCQAPFEIAATLAVLATAHAAADDRSAAENAHRDALAIARQLNSQVLLTQLSAIVYHQPASRVRRNPALSPRETEVLSLVTKGLTDAEIAEQLGLKRRTITTHLTSIYNKLGVSSRAAATRIAVEQQLI